MSQQSWGQGYVSPRTLSYFSGFGGLDDLEITLGGDLGTGAIDFDFSAGFFDANPHLGAGTSFAALPVGAGNSPWDDVVQSVPSVSEVAWQNVPSPTPPGAEAVVVISTDTEGGQVSVPGNPYIPDVTWRTQPISAPPTSTPGGNMSNGNFDLGTILTGAQQVANIYSTVQNARSGGAVPASQFMPAQMMSGATPAFSPAGSLFDLFTNDTGNTVLVPKKKKRRRRRRLATVSDIRDLAALKQVLGAGELFKTYLAVNGRVR